jgi:hypothetical protein
MPFSPVMDQVYGVLIRPALERSGYIVARADSELHQVAIMRDVVAGIEGADLIVADMTGRNANVFYELGLAHALRKPVILLAQGTTDIPFDLGAYRTVIYEVAFERKPRFRSTIEPQLNTLLAAVGRGEVAFGSPVADYGQPGVPDGMAPEEGGEGILEVLARLNAETPALLEHMGRLTITTENLGSAVTRASERLAEAPPGRELPHAISVADDLAADWDILAAELESEVDAGLAPIADLLEKAAVSAVRLAQLGTYTTEDAANLEPYRQLAAASARNADSTHNFASTIRSLSGITAKLRASGGRLSAIVDRVAVTSERLARIADLIPPAPDSSPRDIPVR